MTRAVLVALVACPVLVATGSAVSARSDVRSQPGELVWVQTKTVVNPTKDPVPRTEWSISTRSGHMDWTVNVPPQADFDVDYKPPPSRLTPATKHTITVTVQGRITGGTDTQGFRTVDAILLVNDRWDRQAVGVGVNCYDPIGAEPISCTPPARKTGPLVVPIPTAYKVGDTFSFGIGALNCGNACYVRYEYVASGASPAKKKPPTPYPSSGSLAIDYSMPTRFGLPGKNGLIEYHDGYEEVDPDEWRVDFTVRRRDGKPCGKGDGLTVSATKAVRSRVDGTCAFHVVYKKEGVYTVQVKLTAADGRKLSGRQTFPLQDWLIVGLGDSNGSGEGTPDVPRRGARPARWQSRQCHRSANSYQAQTARAIERGDRRTSVTFVHLACSGATIVNLLAPYEGIEPDSGSRLPAQVAAMKDLVGDREVDAVLVSAGVNDLRFGAMVGHCIGNNDCSNVEFPDAKSPRTLAQEMVRMLRLLPNRFSKMTQGLRAAGVQPRRIHLTEYFDSTRDDKGVFCNPLIRVYGKGTFDQAEAKWAHDRVLLKLNQAVRAATTENKLGRVLSGAYSRFREHGYCADDSWIVRLTESFLGQLNKEGTLHSTTRGNAEQTKLATPILRSELYPGGRARAPKR